MVETPSRAAAASIPDFNDSGKPEGDATRGLLAEAELGGVRHVVRDDDELGVAPCESHFDAARVDLAPDLESSLAEEVEQVEMERRSERVAHAASGL